MVSLSIIIPVYNVEKYLEQCLDSVLVDNGFTGQVICVNDGSTDGSGEILEEYAKKYPNVEVYTQPNLRQSVARNNGLSHATGDYVFYIDSDDWINPGTIQQVLNEIDDEEAIFYNALTYYEVTKSYDPKIDVPTIKGISGAEYFKRIYGTNRTLSFVCECGGFYKREFLLKNHLFNEPGIYHEDTYLMPQILLAAQNVSSVDICVYSRRRHDGSVTSSVTDKHTKDMLYVVRHLYAKYEKRNDIPVEFYKDICNNYIYLIHGACSSGIRIRKYWEWSDCRKMLRCAYDPRSKKMANLTYIHPYLAYLYMDDKLPLIVRRFINRCL
jgi:glycosyltransferase involved in cell wall biosynthesis